MSAVAGVVGWFVIWSITRRLHGVSIPSIDAALTATSLVAQWMMTRKILENWILWIIADIVYVPMYIYKHLYVTSGLVSGIPRAGRYGTRRMEAQLPAPPILRVVLTGSESTGKTTLAHRLAAHYGTVASREFVREYAIARDNQLGFEDHGPIARGQMAAEDEAVARAHRVAFIDTDLVSTAVYCEHYYGRCPAWIADAAVARAGDLYLLMNIDVPWVPDPARDRGDRRQEMHGLFRDRLERLGLPYVEISGDWDQRFAAGVHAVDALLTRQTAG